MIGPSAKPYLLRALYEWCMDEGYTPHIVVKVDNNCRVPMQFVNDGYIVLNIGPKATKNVLMDNTWIEFNARFSGVSQNVLVPVGAVSAIYARETEEGMGFDVQAYTIDESQPSTDTEKSPASDASIGDTKFEKPRFTIVGEDG